MQQDYCNLIPACRLDFPNLTTSPVVVNPREGWRSIQPAHAT